LGGTVIEAIGINDAGQVVGLSSLAGDTVRHAFIYQAGTMQDLGSLGGSISLGYAINAAGAVTGYSTLATKSYRPFLYAGGVMTNLGTVAGDTASARGINDANDVVGDSTIMPNSEIGGPTQTAATADAEHAALFRGGAVIDLGTLGGEYSSAYAINNAGQIVGYAYTTGSEVFHAFMVVAGQPMVDLGTLGGSYSRAYAINAVGQVVGQAYLAGDASAHAFLYQNGAMKDLDTLGNMDSEALAVNAAGLVVGDFDVSDGVELDQRAFVSGGGQMKDLNQLVPSGSGWTLEAAEGVNSAGQIVGRGTVQGQEHAFLLTPTN
jgi:probable HAF family extracellular repeat protein